MFLSLCYLSKRRLQGCGSKKHPQALDSQLLILIVTSSKYSRYLHPRAQFDISPQIPKNTSKGWKQILHFSFKHVFQLAVSILGNGFTIYPVSLVPNLAIILSLPFLCPHPLTNQSANPVSLVFKYLLTLFTSLWDHCFSPCSMPLSSLVQWNNLLTSVSSTLVILQYVFLRKPQ